MIAVSSSKHWLEEISELNPKQNALVTSNNKYTYKYLYDKSVAFAFHLQNAGVTKNECIGILFSHNTNFAIVLNAVWFVNAIPVPLNARSTQEETISQLKQAHARFMITESSFGEIADNIYFQDQSAARIIFYDSISSESTVHFPDPPFCLDDEALMMFTSGSSGKPKIVVHTFKSLYHSVKAMDSNFPLSSNDVWLASLPLYHIGGFMILIRALISSSSVAFPASVHYNDIVKSFNIFAPTHASFVSATLQNILEKKIEPNKNLKYLFLGGGPIATSLCSDAVKAGWPIVKVYGSTETCSMVTAYLLSSEKKFDSVGKPIDDNQIIIKDGEVIVKSSYLFKKYLNDSKTTNHKIINGQFHTGDFGWIDEDGFVYIDSRREDIVITGGENVSVKEVELVLKTFSTVEDVCVFGLTDNKWGQQLCAAIVTKNISETKLKNHLKDILPSFKIPKQFFFLTKIPRNEMGKVNRESLLKMISLNDH